MTLICQKVMIIGRQATTDKSVSLLVQQEGRDILNYGSGLRGG